MPLAVPNLLNENSDPNNWFERSIVPGIAGHTGNDYIKNFIHYCREAGFDVVSYNWRPAGQA